ncbi:MAG TPA: LuxR C-terminal-related transcriptional regulator [Acidimicrobiia bacterium]|nr:LuxR C-terminal-related transcriptional regulator [Acidimicrobiia bacterium]
MERSDPVAVAREALDRHDWQGAYDAATGLTGEALEPRQETARLELVADASWWLGRLDDCIEARERAYVAHDELGDRRRSGQCAVWLYEHRCFKARPAIAGAWLRRARQALADDPDCAEHGALLLREAEVAHGGGDLDQAERLATAVVGLGRRLRSPDLEAEALQTSGRVLIDQGRPTEGLADLDEAMLFAVEGRLSPYGTGKVYCSMISAREELGDVRRAAEWTDATGRWSQRHPFAVFPGLCRVHRASALQWRGEWADAEREATRACEELAGVNLPNAAAGFVEIGEIRRRLGDLDGAEAAFRRAEELCCQPQAGLALLRLAQGRIDAATAIINRALEAETWNRLARARLLAAAAQIAVAAGDTAAAGGAVDELEAIASDYGSPILLATAASARGRLQVAQRDAAACGTLGVALKRWQELDVPYEVATARLLLGLACRDGDDHDAAAASFAAAESVFEQLGAALDVRRVRELTSRRQLPGGLTDREVEVLRLVVAGGTNREIAAALYLSEKTVARHLSNIFTKVGVSSRAAATAYAFEQGIVSRC